MAAKTQKQDDPLLYEGQFVDGDARKVCVRITVPKRESDRKWVCLFQIEEDGAGPFQRAAGADGLQCLAVAENYIRKCLIPRAVLEKNNNTPPELIFNRSLPVGYGLDFQKLMEARLDLEIAKMEFKISEKRRIRQK